MIRDQRELPAKLTGTGIVDSWGRDFEVPDYTIDQIRAAIPESCFKKSTPLALSYLIRDVFCVVVTHYIFNSHIFPATEPSIVLWSAAVAVYTFIQGLFMTGLWVIGHEAGHHAFTASKTLSDLFGYIVHVALLVPYFSWQISHAAHHRNHGNIEKDMVYVPRLRENYSYYYGFPPATMGELVEETPLATFINIVLTQLFAWPLYLFFNASGHDNHEAIKGERGKGKHNGFMGQVNHFDPASPIFDAKDAIKVHLSNVGLLVMGLILYIATQKYGWKTVTIEYWVPWLWVNHWQGKSKF